MRQDREEPIRAFGARLKGQANILNNVYWMCNYTEAMIRDVLFRGLEDSEIQLDLFGHGNRICLWKRY